MIKATYKAELNQSICENENEAEKELELMGSIEASKKLFFDGHAFVMTESMYFLKLDPTLLVLLTGLHEIFTHCFGGETS